MEIITDDELIKQLKDRLDEHKNTIQELQSVSEELRLANIKLEESEALKSHFISNITNELINPFASIMALSREILELKGKQDWAKVEMMVGLIHSETFFIDFQLRNIFAAARVEAGEAVPEISNVDMANLLQNTIELFVTEAEKHQIEIKTHVENNGNDIFEFKTDPVKIRLILINFINNSIKFSGNKSIITISLKKNDDNLLEIVVDDNGRGIPTEFHADIYDRFKKCDRTINSVTRGSGLGLSINKAYVDVLGGSIDFTSEIGKGTTFKVLIPESKGDINAYSDGGNEFFFDDEFII